jgi:hypothetical protein
MGVIKIAGFASENPHRRCGLEPCDLKLEESLIAAELSQMPIPEGNT